MKTLFSLLAFITTILLAAQNYHPLVETGKLWSNYHNYCDSRGAFSLFEKLTDDTIIAGYTWKKILSTKDSLQSGWSLSGFLREDPDRRVYYADLYGSQMVLYYDFGLSVGDTVVPFDEPDMPYVVDSVTTVELLDGQIRNRFVLRCAGLWCMADSCYAYWIEGIGSLHGLFQPVMCGMVGDNPALMCFWEGTTLQFHNPDFEACFVSTGIPHHTSGFFDIEVYPNPSQDLLVIEFRGDAVAPLHLELVDLLGHSCLTHPLNHPQTTLSLKETGIIPGLYIYCIKGKEGLIHSGKIVYE